mgnify:CR=1 FL=1
MGSGKRKKTRHKNIKKFKIKSKINKMSKIQNEERKTKNKEWRMRNGELGMRTKDLDVGQETKKEKLNRDRKITIENKRI